MASTNKTSNYDLPQFLGTDKASWLGDINPAMQIIDDIMKQNESNANQAISSSDNAVIISNGAEAKAQNALSNTQNLTDIVNNLSVWDYYTFENPDTVNFETYSGGIWTNRILGISSIQCVIRLKSGYIPSFSGNTGTPLIQLPPTYFNDTYESVLYNTGVAITSAGTVSPQFKKFGSRIISFFLAETISSMSYITISRMLYTKNWLK